MNAPKLSHQLSGTHKNRLTTQNMKYENVEAFQGDILTNHASLNSSTHPHNPSSTVSTNPPTIIPIQNIAPTHPVHPIQANTPTTVVSHMQPDLHFNISQNSVNNSSEVQKSNTVSVHANNPSIIHHEQQNGLIPGMLTNDTQEGSQGIPVQSYPHSEVHINSSGLPINSPGGTMKYNSAIPGNINILGQPGLVNGMTTPNTNMILANNSNVVIPNQTMMANNQVISRNQIISTHPIIHNNSIVQNNSFIQTNSHPIPQSNPIPANKPLMPMNPIVLPNTILHSNPMIQNNYIVPGSQLISHNSVLTQTQMPPNNQLLQGKSGALMPLSVNNPPPSPPPLSRERYLKKASVLSARNRFKEAVELYIEALHYFPNDSELYNCKGFCLKNLDQVDDALKCYNKALELDSSNASAWNNQGFIYKEKQFYEKAISSYFAALQCDPNHKTATLNLAVALTDLGTKLKSEGLIQESLKKYIQAYQTDPTYSPCLYNLGVIHSEMGDYTQAMSMYSEAVKLNPRYVEAFNNMGAICKNLNQLCQAIMYYEKALQINPNFEMSKGNLAVALTDLGTQVKIQGFIKEGVKHYKKALVYNPHYGEAYYNLGVAYGEQYKYDKALVYYQLAVSFNPNCAEAYNNLGVIYKDKENLDKAIYYYKKALEVNPKFSQTLNNIGVIYTIVGKMTEAYDYTMQAIKENPKYSEAYNNLGVLYRDQGDVNLAIEAYEKSIEIDPTARNASQNRLLALNYVDGHKPNYICGISRDWGDLFLSLHSRTQFTSWNCIRDENRPITIGYIGPDFFCHSVSYFIEAPLRFHNPQNVNIIVYANVVKEDDKTQMFKKLTPVWKSIVGMSEKNVAELIRNDCVDILIELTGHTANNRMDVLTWKPAPIQMTWIGYPNTTGLSTIDYRISDRYADPEDTDQPYVEQIIHMPNCFLCYTPGENPPIPPTPCLENEFITFGSFNNLAKIGPQVVKLWSKILRAFPNSRLLVKARPFANSSIQKKFAHMFREEGISTNRLDLMGLIPGCADHLKAYGLMDIALDTFPYAGTTTTCESLLMGVPVVTLKGKSNHAHNVGVSLLHNIGHDELICDDKDSYVEKALRLAADPQKLSEYRSNLRADMLNSHLGDGKTFTKDLENLFKKVFTKWCRSE